MSDERRPEAVWVFPEEKKSNRGGVWLIVLLSILALAIVGTLLFYLLPKDTGDEPSPTPSASASATRTASPAPTSSPTPTPTVIVPTPTVTPDETAEPDPGTPADPDQGAFAASVQPRLDDAATGLSIAAGQTGADAAQIIDGLQSDAGVLSDTPAPAAIASAWADAVLQYAARLSEARSAFDTGADAQPALDAAKAALQHMRSVAGL